MNEEAVTKLGAEKWGERESGIESKALRFLYSAFSRRHQQPSLNYAVNTCQLS